MAECPHTAPVADLQLVKAGPTLQHIHGTSRTFVDRGDGLTD
jgi:hypothetical protein